MTGRRPEAGRAHVAGDRSRPLIEATVPGFLAEVVRRYGERPAAVFCATGERWTYRELMARVDRLAAGLLAQGVYRGERVGIWAPNRPEWLLTQLATARIGAVLVTINPAYRAGELEHALRLAQVGTLILARGHRGSDYLDILTQVAPELPDARPGALRASALPGLRRVILMGRKAPGTLSFDAVLASGRAGGLARLDAIGRGLSPCDPINIQFTSGTTGAPKGATLTHRGIINNAISVARAMKLEPGDAVAIPVPLYHCFGMVLGVLAACAYGAKMVFPGEGFEPGEVLAALDEEGCTAVHGVPTMFAAMLDHPDFAKRDLRSLRTGIMAGAPCPEALMRRVMREMGARGITIAYGMTETSPVSFQTAPDDPLSARVATVGRVQPHVEARIVDADGQVVGVGEAGELQTRGYLVMRGYWRDPERSAQVIHDGWMQTGDRASLDAEGYCRILGRVDDMILRGGENVYPAEVEALLAGHPDIAQVQVFGIPDARLGQEVGAWVIPQAGRRIEPETLRDWAKARLTPFKVPRAFRIVDAFPMTATGKPQKFRMAEAMAQEGETKCTS